MPGGPKLGYDRETATKFLTVATGGKRARAHRALPICREP